MTHMGSCISAMGVRPVISHVHKFSTTYLWGSYSPIDGDSFVWEIEGISTKIFESYLSELSKHRPEQYKIVVIDNAGFHSTNKITIPPNKYLLNIPPYSPELNPCEQVWAYIKTKFKNQVFNNMEMLRKWLDKSVIDMSKETIKSITSNHHYL